MALITARYVVIALILCLRAEAKLNPLERIDQLVNQTNPGVNDPKSYAKEIEKILADGCDSILKKPMRYFVELSGLGDNPRKSCQPLTLPLLENIRMYLGKQSENKGAKFYDLKIERFIIELIQEHGQDCQLENASKYNALRTLTKETTRNLEEFGKAFMAQLFKLTHYVPSKMDSKNKLLSKLVNDADIELLALTNLVRECEESVRRTIDQGSIEHCLIANVDKLLYTSTKLSENLSKLAILGVLKQTAQANFHPHEPYNGSHESNRKFNTLFRLHLEEPCDKVHSLGYRFFELLDVEQKLVDRLDFYKAPPENTQFAYAWLGYSFCKMITTESYANHSTNLLSCIKRNNPATEFKKTLQSDYLEFV